MFDITSTLKKFFSIEDTSVESASTSFVRQTSTQDTLSQAPQPYDMFDSHLTGGFKPRALSCNQPYYFFEQETSRSLPHYLTQETSFEETPCSFTNKILEKLGDKVQGKGICKESQTGLVYLDISLDYILDLAPFFASEGGQLPLLQAHIAIISPDEANQTGLSIEDAVGMECSFTITECEEVSFNNWKGVEKVWILKVYSEELEAFRKKFGLCPRMHGKAFHILVSIKPSQTSSPKPSFFRVSPIIQGV